MTEVAQLSSAERARLVELEREIGAGLSTFLRVGRALQEIQQRRLWRATHASFRAYVVERWELSESRASQLAASARAADAIGGVLPENLSETALRQLVPVHRERGDAAVVDAWARVLEVHDGDRPPTAEQVRAVLLEAGLPVFGRAPGHAHRPRLDQLDALLSNARARVERLREQAERDLDAGEVRRLAATCRALASMLDAIGGVVTVADVDVDGSELARVATGPRCECRKSVPNMGVCDACGLEVAWRPVMARIA